MLSDGWEMYKMKRLCRCLAVILVLALAMNRPLGVQATLTQEEQEESLKKREAKKKAVKTGQEGEAQTEPEQESEMETEPEQESETEAEPKPDVETDTEEERVLLVAIDPCHQGPGADITSEEAMGPGADEMCPRASEGGIGCVSGQEEYDLNLQVAQKLEKELKTRGYDVILTRTANDVDLSNKERCEVANKAGADIMVRLYASSNEDENVYGAHVYCPTEDSPYLGEFYDSCLNLADSVEDAYCAATGISNHGIWMTDRIAGINWCKMPVVQLEMGNLKNQYNDAYMSQDDNRDVMAKGIADGIDNYFGR